MQLDGISQSHILALAPSVGPVHVIEPEDREVIQAVRAINETEVFGSDRELTFSFDRQTHRPLVRIINRETKELIKQIPPQQIVEMAKELLEAPKE